MFHEIQWLFFDVGSTLVDEQFAYRRRFHEIAAAAGVTDEFVMDTALDFYKRNQKGDRETAKLLGVTMPTWHSEDEFLYHDAADCLKALCQRYRLGVIANQNPGTKDRLAAFGLLPYLDLVVASAEEGVAKPDRRIFEIALERAHCAPEQAVMIGDRIDNDILPAKALGMKTVWVRQGFGGYWRIMRQEEVPDETVRCLRELPDIL